MRILDTLKCTQQVNSTRKRHENNHYTLIQYLQIDINIKGEILAEYILHQPVNIGGGLDVPTNPSLRALRKHTQTAAADWASRQAANTEMFCRLSENFLLWHDPAHTCMARQLQGNHIWSQVQNPSHHDSQHIAWQTWYIGFWPLWMSVVLGLVL